MIALPALYRNLPAARLDRRADPVGVGGTVLGLGVVASVGWLTRTSSPWMAMWAVATTEFFLLKVITVRAYGRHASLPRLLAYFALWPGMNAESFLRPEPVALAAPLHELALAVLRLASGIALLGRTTRHAFDAPVLLVGWTGMLALILTLHFGCFHAISWLWRHGGVIAPPIMRRPLAAGSLAEFWGERWNVAFAESARRLLLRPLARRWGVRRAGAFVFLVSGLVHESVISLPARGGWGGPTLYFLLQAAGIWVEKTPVGRRWGLGAGLRGRAWALALTGLPLPLLFHAPFAERVIVPFFRVLNEAL